MFRKCAFSVLCKDKYSKDFHNRKLPDSVPQQSLDENGSMRTVRWERFNENGSIEDGSMRTVRIRVIGIRSAREFEVQFKFGSIQYQSFSAWVSLTIHFSFLIRALCFRKLHEGHLDVNMDIVIRCFQNMLISLMRVKVIRYFRP